MARADGQNGKVELAVTPVSRYFEPDGLDSLSTVTRIFPATVRPDLERAIETLLGEQAHEANFLGIHREYGYDALKFADIFAERHHPPIIGPAQYLDIDIGAEEPGRCVVTGLWLFRVNGGKAGLLVSQQPPQMGLPGVRVEAVASPAAGGRETGQTLLVRLSQLLSLDSVYRGRILSFATERNYDGGLGDLTVHRFPKTERADIILPNVTLNRLERTLFGFVAQRPALKELGFSLKRGILLHGAPGTGKTHYIRYALSQLSEHTALIVTAEQVAFFDQVMIIARALQPSIVIIEDADLIARAREQADGICSEMLLNKLLNHMDGLTEDSEIIFILTTNRPETLEAAIRDRPGRIDQTVEIPKPDEVCRARLLDLYCGRLPLADGVRNECVRRTEGVTASFIRELARRMAQFALLRGPEPHITEADMRLAFEDLFAAGTLTAQALGATADSR